MKNGGVETEMRRVDDIIEEFDHSDPTDKKKITLIEWFQKHPGKRFDLSEIQAELGDELGVGQTRTRQILRELDNDDSVLTSHGEKRKAYELREDILIPIKYQALAGLRHLLTVVDIQRWGVVGVAVASTALWAFLTFPFWIISLYLFISPQNRFGPISGSEFGLLSLGMTIWLVIGLILTSILQIIRGWWKN